jgi:ATP-dependent Clp protease ATP-binding subunit ClpB
MQYLVSGSELLSSMPGFKLVGRDKELKSLSSVLMRSKAASVILVGPGGVGTSALIIGLQAMKDLDTSTFDIVSKRLFWLKTDELFSAGNQDAVGKGFQGVLDILYRTPDSILIIEDARDFIDAARNMGCSHFINALNSCVKNGKTQVILETRDGDLDIVLNSHSDMKQCYTLIDVAEPIGEDLKEIVFSSSERLQKHHGIRIAEDAVLSAIELTNKYRTRDASLSRAQPERSANLLDRALSTYRLDAHQRHPKIQKAILAGEKMSDEEIAELDKGFAVTQTRIKELFKLQRDGEIAVINLEETLAAQIESEKVASENVVEEDNSARRIAMFSSSAKSAGFGSAKVREIRAEIAALQKAISDNKVEFDALTGEINDQLILTKDFVLAEFSRLSGIPANKLNEDEREKLKSLEAVLNSRVFGQKDVIAKIANAIKVSRVGQRNGSKPQAAFLIMGPSGTGKTEACKALAFALKDDEAALTRFDMSEYMEKHSVAKLIGAPAGYEGSERGGILTNAMRSNPNRIILFDEIEKADPAVFDLFLQILSDGRLTDNHGRTVDFSESMIIMTTNIGQSFFLDVSLGAAESEHLANIELDQIYRPEFLNRFAGRQNIVCFSRLDIPTIVKIVERELNGLKIAYKKHGSMGVNIEYDVESVVKFCEDHYDPRHGARGLQGYIVARIEPMIVNAILDGAPDNSTFKLVYDIVKKEFGMEII